MKPARLLGFISIALLALSVTSLTPAQGADRKLTQPTDGCAAAARSAAETRMFVARDAKPVTPAGRKESKALRLVSDAKHEKYEVLVRLDERSSTCFNVTLSSPPDCKLEDIQSLLTRLKPCAE